MNEPPSFNHGAFRWVIVAPSYNVGVNWREKAAKSFDLGAIRRVIAPPNCDVGENSRIIGAKSIVVEAKNLDFVENLKETADSNIKHPPESQPFVLFLPRAEILAPGALQIIRVRDAHHVGGPPEEVFRLDEMVTLNGFHGFR